MGVGDILTISCGTFSNSILTHVINNEEVQMGHENALNLNEISFKSIFNLNEQPLTYIKPRVIFVEKSENLSYTCIDELGKDINKIIDSPLQKNKFQTDLNIVKNNKLNQKDGSNLYDTKILSSMPHNTYPSLLFEASHWQDYLHTILPAKSIIPIKDFKQMSEEFDDSIHYFSEQSDCFQGIHYLTDNVSDYAHIITNFNEYLSDEFPKKALFNFATFPWWRSESMGISKFWEEILFAALTLQHTFNAVDVIYPLSLFRDAFQYQTYESDGAKQFLYDPSIIKRLDPLNDYQTSALFALGIDSITLPYRRLAIPSFDMRDLMNMLSFEESCTKVRSIFTNYVTGQGYDYQRIKQGFSLTPYNIGLNEPHASKFINITRGFNISATNSSKDQSETFNFNNLCQLSPAFPEIFKHEPDSIVGNPFRSVACYNSVENSRCSDCQFFKPLLNSTKRAVKSFFNHDIEKDELKEVVEFLSRF